MYGANSMAIVEGFLKIWLKDALDRELWIVARIEVVSLVASRASQSAVRPENRSSEASVGRRLKGLFGPAVEEKRWWKARIG